MKYLFLILFFSIQGRAVTLLSEQQKADIAIEVAAARVMQDAFLATNLDNTTPAQVNDQINTTKAVWMINWLLTNTNCTLNP